DSILAADPRGALAFFVLVPLALALLPGRTPPQFHMGGVVVASLIGLVLDMAVFSSRFLQPRPREAVHIFVVGATVLAIAAMAGPRLSPFATMFLMWMATAASIRLSS